MLEQINVSFNRFLGSNLESLQTEVSGTNGRYDKTYLPEYIKWTNKYKRLNKKNFITKDKSKVKIRNG